MPKQLQPAPRTEGCHVIDSYQFEEWMAAHLEMETEGERTPAQTDPDPVVMDPNTPALLRKQAA